MMTVYWLVGAAVLLILEIITVSLTSIWFAGGAIAAAIVSTFVDSILIETGVFLLVSVVLLLVTRPLAKKFINGKIEKTNADALIGKKCKVAQTIDPEQGTGKVVINGLEWSARTKSGDVVVPKGTKVTIVEIIGVRLVVEPEAETPEEDKSTETIPEKAADTEEQKAPESVVGTPEETVAEPEEEPEETVETQKQNSSEENE